MVNSKEQIECPIVILFGIVLTSACGIAALMMVGYVVLTRDYSAQAMTFKVTAIGNLLKHLQIFGGFW